MKQLLILRHAKASRDELLVNDHDRPLKVRGMLNAIRMGQLLRDQGLLPDVILASTALRAKHTAELVAQHSRFQGQVQLNRQLYHAAPRTYIDCVRHLSADSNSCLLVGHNPGMHDLVAQLNQAPEHFPTAALAIFTLDIREWMDLSLQSSCKLDNIFRVKDLDEAKVTIGRP